MRGKVQPDADGCRPPRITPAYAGKRRAAKRYKRLLWDHPRVCGEKDAICKSCPARQGSPPRMRGKARQAVYKDIKHGITLAYAGKSRVAALRLTLHRDHPRVCGEKCALALHGLAPQGSPPRMRGKVQHFLLLGLLPGITPAYAGKSTIEHTSRVLKEDHPRVCGEKFLIALSQSFKEGSPPRMRGKAKQNRVGTLERRITPAYAGKSRRTS